MADEHKTKHPQYEMTQYAWFQVRACLLGEDTVKRFNEFFLPMPAAMLQVKAPPSIQTSSPGQAHQPNRRMMDFDATEWDPNWHRNPAYRAYKTRAEFPDFTAATLRGMMGLSDKSPPRVELPDSISYLEERATNDGRSLEDLYTETLRNVLAVGRHILVLDVRADNTLYISSYVAESNINWKVGSVAPGTETEEEALVLAVLKEPEEEDVTEFTHEDRFQYRVLRLEDGTYTVSMYDHDGNSVVMDESEGAEDEFSIAPSVRDQTFPRIPMVMVGSTDVLPDVDLVPLKGLSSTALAIYRKTADQSQNQFMSCNPMLVVTGADKGEVPNVIGATVTWTFENPDAKAQYTQTDTGALQYVQSNIESLFVRAEQQGATLLGADKKGGVESGDALRIRRSSQGATLVSVVSSVSAAFEQLLKMATSWAGGNPDEVVFQGNKEFNDLTLSSAELRELFAGWERGGLSRDSLFWNLQRAGLVPEERTYEEELALIQQGAALAPGLDGSTEEDELDEEEEEITEETP